MMMLDSIWAKLFIVLAIIGLIKWGHYQVDLGGYNRHKSEISDNKDDADKKDEGKVKVVIEYRTKVKKVYVDKVKKIYVAKDPTGCRNTKLIDMGIGLQ